MPGQSRGENAVSADVGDVGEDGDIEEAGEGTGDAGESRDAGNASEGVASEDAVEVHQGARPEASGDAWKGEPSDNLPVPGVFKFGFSGVWHFEIGEIISSIGGYRINSKKHHDPDKMPFVEGWRTLSAPHHFRGLCS
ncbi:hypothetical protein HK097_004786 [Rhizophlyctis rosea]|uniref:Uncharacterized protein n=1 Tax=Rhizophlyctis rosea TaxID=64517 RepID=A0AAD5S2Q1_9FUNG|nr:hypothetical protein HK097_004786 [Rhizophlyctis rosea]